MIRESEDSLYEPQNVEDMLDDSLYMAQSQTGIMKNNNTINDSENANQWGSINIDRGH